LKQFLRLVVVAMLIIAGLLMVVNIIYKLFFMPNEQVVEAFKSKEVHLIIDGEEIITKNPPKVVGGQILLSFEDIRTNIDKDIWYDKNEQGASRVVSITTKNRVVRMQTEKLNAVVNDKPVDLKIPANNYEGVLFLPIEFLAEFYDIDVNYNSENNVVIIDDKTIVKRIGYPLDAMGVLRRDKSIRAPIVKLFDLSTENREDNQIYITNEFDKWFKARTADGIIGYIEKRYVVVEKYQINKLKQPEIKPHNNITGKLNLVWEMNYQGTPDLSLREPIDGLDVVSFTWFKVNDERGNLSNSGNSVLVDWAHNHGYEVWGLVANDFSNPDKTSKLLHNSEARMELIRQILAYAALYRLDGINIDFENINLSDKDAYTQLIREMSPLLKEQGLIVSVDVGVMGGSDNWSKCYDRQALAESVDYLCVMTYDQYWSTSPKAGPVAQMSWVENKIQEIIEIVPREKVLLGLPYYTRLWKEYKDENGNQKVKTEKHLSIDEAKALVDEKSANITWDEESGQYYAEYEEAGAKYRMWMENERSLDLKSSLALKYQLAGVCAWSGNFVKYDNKGIWTVLNTNLKELNHYQEWEFLKKQISN